MYGFDDGDREGLDLLPPKKWRQIRVAKKKICSEKGRTSGPNVVMLVLRASPPISIRSLLTLRPLKPCSSSSW